MSAPLLSIESPSHCIEVQKVKENEATASLLLSESGIPLLKDFEITATIQSSQFYGRPFAVVEEGAVMVSLCPKFGEDDEELQKNEVIFLVDRR